MQKLAHYRKYIFTYGILSVLFVLKHFEENEQYEECQKIIDAIKEQEEKLNITLFTTITKDNIELVIEVYKKFNLAGKNVIENSKYYSLGIIKEIEAEITLKKCNQTK